jgi:hypothetical protein
MAVDDAQYHMKRCIDSGLWDPQGGAADDKEGDAEDDAVDTSPSAEVDD